MESVQRSELLLFVIVVKPIPMPASKAKSEFKKPVEPAAPKPAGDGLAPLVPKKGMHPIQLVRGMRDLLPSDQPYWKMAYQEAENLAESYGYERIDTPFVEDTSLFVRGVGKATDIVEKELYSWETPGGEHVSLRPEGTAPVVRAYVQHGMLNLPQPVKLWYLGPLF